MKESIYELVDDSGETYYSLGVFSSVESAHKAIDDEIKKYGHPPMARANEDRESIELHVVKRDADTLWPWEDCEVVSIRKFIEQHDEGADEIKWKEF
jgi:hypothetical protein